jgi:hypothetical protein
MGIWILFNNLQKALLVSRNFRTPLNLTQSTEILLTLDEIKQIEYFVLQNPHLANPNCFNIGTDPCSIIKISPKTGLILVQGNEFTGFEHIHSRHEFFSIIPYWTEVEKNNGQFKMKLQDQSRFRPDSVPFWDYINIADSLYKAENLNVEKNRRQNDFDLYYGNHKNKDGILDLYKMLVYKDSKIIHTFYPQANKNNKKRLSNFNFYRGIVNARQYYEDDLVEISIPYLNSDKKIKYSILIRKYLGHKMEEAIILVHDENENPNGFVSAAERKFSNFDSVPIEILFWQHTDLRNLENYIKKIDNQFFYSV